MDGFTPATWATSTQDNFLFVADRKKDMIISGGENIYSREVEEALMLHPSVEEVAVIGVPDQEWGESVKACVVLRAGQSAGFDELVEHCRNNLASYKKPRTHRFSRSVAAYAQRQDRQEVSPGAVLGC